MFDEYDIAYLREPPSPVLQSSFKVPTTRYPIVKNPDLPRVFAVASSRLPFPAVESKPRDCMILFRTRCMNVQLSSIHNRYWPNVRRVSVQPSRIQPVFDYIFNLFPFMRKIFPEWCLPATFIMKREKLDEAELFDTEVASYRQLAPLQGVHIPQCYGVARYKISPTKESRLFEESRSTTRCLLLQDVGGASLIEPAGLTLQLETLADMLEEKFDLCHGLGLLQEDSQLANYRVVDGKLIALDFERVVPNESEEDALCNKYFAIEDLVRDYQEFQYEDFTNGKLVDAAADPAERKHPCRNVPYFDGNTMTVQWQSK